MSKYQPLGEHLTQIGADRVPMSFEQIEEVLGFKLPPSSARREWWSNNGERHVQTQVWRKAGYKTEAVNIEAGELVFRRVADASGPTSSTSAGDGGKRRRIHPLFGCMKGLTKIPEGVDLTAPADPDWGNSFD